MSQSSETLSILTATVIGFAAVARIACVAGAAGTVPAAMLHGGAAPHCAMAVVEGAARLPPAAARAVRVPVRA